MTGAHRFRRGLVVGKFAPLHRGHELLIQRALAECAEVVVLSYSKPEHRGCGAEVRTRWISTLFPSVRVVVLAEPETSLPENTADALTHRRFVGGVCAQRLGLTVDAVFTSEGYGPGFAEELTRYFRATIAPSAAAVIHVEVDRARATVPIAGSRLRSDVHSHRTWLDPRVYATFVQRVGLLGGESTGKSTLAARLAREWATVHVSEYGRERWEQREGRLEFDDLRAIASEQVAREEAAALQAARFVFCDTTPLTTKLYAQDLFGRTDPLLEQLARRSYAATFLCAPDFPFVQDGTRRDESFRQWQHAWYLQELQRTGVAFTLLTGPLDSRVRQVAQTLATLSA